MNDKGLERKCKMQGYLKRIEEQLQAYGTSTSTVEDTLFT